MPNEPKKSNTLLKFGFKVLLVIKYVHDIQGESMFIRR